jgi:diguanylate cyclase (GGDEF)-like protein
LTDWELAFSKGLRAFRLVSIKNRMLVFAALATLIPSLSTAWISYLQNSRALNEKIAEELSGASTQTAREMDLWLKERVYEVRVFASSYEVSENLDRQRRSLERFQAIRRLDDYLTSVNERFSDYQELLVVDPQARVVARSTADTAGLYLPDTWIEEIRAREAITGVAYWDSTAGRELMTVAVAINAVDGRSLGALAAKLNLGSVADTLKRFAPGQNGEVYLITRQGNVVVSSRESSPALLERALSAGALRSLRQRSGPAVTYTNYRGTASVGALVPIPALDWAVVAEIPSEEAFRQIAGLRNFTILTVVSLLLVIGLIAYAFGLTIVRPLHRLSTGAAQVAAGDLSVSLPVLGTGEVALVTEVFNEMVSRLREGRDELEKLSRTDALTGLPNRRNLMETLDREGRRATRAQRPFSLLMIDVDQFKQYNDTFGHLAGDEVLGGIATILTECIRTADYAARYGGEEFTVLLPETPLGGALEVAERIRSRVAGERLRNRQHVTVSIGVGEFPTHGDSPEAVMAGADAALYEAKQQGRNRVHAATGIRRSRQLTALSDPPLAAPAPVSSSESPARRGAARRKRGTKKPKKRQP